MTESCGARFGASTRIGSFARDLRKSANATPTGILPPGTLQNNSLRPSVLSERSFIRRPLRRFHQRFRRPAALHHSGIGRGLRKQDRDFADQDATRVRLPSRCPERRYITFPSSEISPPRR